MKSAGDAPSGWSRAAAAGLAFRHAGAADEPFLFRLYASTRSEELAPVPWSEEEKEAFLFAQARAQHAHYQQHFAAADWLVIEREGTPVGRLYLDRREATHHIIDIAFLPEWRNRGLGGALLRDLIDEAAGAGKAMSIRVEKFNRAMSFYARLGFVRIEEQGAYDLMRRTPPAASTPG
jgi:ribosomal protein S18 acetylase RimI-like enzyme